MTDDPDAKLVNSNKSQRVLVDGYPFSIQIYRLGKDKTWTLEVVDHKGTSHVWDEQFRSDRDARYAAIEALESEGAIAFMRGGQRDPVPEVRERRPPLGARHSAVLSRAMTP